jgi:nicotinamidase-related amidase
MRTGLLIVDLQEGFGPSEALVDAIRLEAEKHCCVVQSRFTNAIGSLYRTALDWHGDGGLMALQIDGAVIFEKTGYGLTQAQTDVLRAMDCDEWHVCGLETDACVLACAFSLWDAGLRPRIRAEICASPLHAEGLAVAVRQFGN